MIRIIPSQYAIDQHIKAVLNRIDKGTDKNVIIEKIKDIGAVSIEDFLIADVGMMRKWIQECPDKLKFTQFKEIYNNYFSNGANTFVDGNYNAYTFLENMNITVCPYCEDEYLDIVNINDRTRRTCEIDHFFPKNRYPALAMSFFNLVPSGQKCNGLKMENELGTNPYEDNIENLTFLYPDIPVGISMDQIEPNDCKVLFHSKVGMEQNVNILGLEQRYERYAPEAHQKLKNLQNYNEEKIQELVKLGIDTRENLLRVLFGPQKPEEKKKCLRQKMLKDLTGY